MAPLLGLHFTLWVIQVLSPVTAFLKKCWCNTSNVSRSSWQTSTRLLWLSTVNSLGTHLAQTLWYPKSAIIPWAEPYKTFNASETFWTVRRLSPRINSSARSRFAFVTDVVSRPFSVYLHSLRFSISKLLHLPHIADVHYSVPINLLQAIVDFLRCTTFFCQKFSDFLLDSDPCFESEIRQSEKENTI